MMGQCLGSEVTKEMKTARIRSTQIDQDLYQSAIRKMNVVKRERERYPPCCPACCAV